MVRYFALIFAVFLLYWIVKGTMRRLFGFPGKRPVPRARGERPAKPVAENRKNPGIDYSKVKDASYRDLKD